MTYMQCVHVRLHVIVGKTFWYLHVTKKTNLELGYIDDKNHAFGDAISNSCVQDSPSKSFWFSSPTGCTLFDGSCQS